MGSNVTPSVRTRRGRLSLGLLVLSATLCLGAMGCANGDNAPANPAADAVVPPPDGPVDGPAAVPPVEDNTDSGGADDGADPRHVVFVVDRSGSMVTVFDYVRVQIQLSISELGEDQQFHIVLFADEKTIEGPKNCLVKATAENKAAAVQFLHTDETRPQGKTTAMVALKRAFQVLESAGDKKDKLILLLTDGELAGIGGGSRYKGKGKGGNEAVLSFLKDANAKGSVKIDTYLFGKDSKATVVMKDIAALHGGTFKALEVE